MSDEQAVNPHPLHEELATVLANHQREHGAHAEHLAVHVDFFDLMDWQEHARVNYERGWALRTEREALHAQLAALREWDEALVAAKEVWARANARYGPPDRYARAHEATSVAAAAMDRLRRVLDSQRQAPPAPVATGEGQGR